MLASVAHPVHHLIEPITAFRSEYDFLSNFYPAPVDYEGMTYPTVEHACQAAKSLDNTVRRKIQALATLAAAKSAGKRIVRRADWFAVNLAILEALVQQKFTRYPDLGDRLLATGERELIEGNTWNDRFFGMVCDKKNRSMARRKSPGQNFDAGAGPTAPGVGHDTTGISPVRRCAARFDGLKAGFLSPLRGEAGTRQCDSRVSGRSPGID